MIFRLVPFRAIGFPIAFRIFLVFGFPAGFFSCDWFSVWFSGWFFLCDWFSSWFSDWINLVFGFPIGFFQAVGFPVGFRIGILAVYSNS